MAVKLKQLGLPLPAALGIFSGMAPADRFNYAYLSGFWLDGRPSGHYPDFLVLSGWTVIGPESNMSHICATLARPPIRKPPICLRGESYFCDRTTCSIVQSTHRPCSPEQVIAAGELETIAPTKFNTSG